MTQYYSPFNFSNASLSGTQPITANPNSYFNMPTVSLQDVPSATVITPQMHNQAQQNLSNIQLNQGNGFGFNMPTLQLGLQGLNAISGLYFGSKAMGMAKDQFNFSKQMAQTNLRNQVNSYNTGLEDRLRTREQFNTGASGDAWKSDFERLKATT